MPEREKVAVYHPQPVCFPETSPCCLILIHVMLVISKLLNFLVYPQPTLNVTWLLTRIRINFVVRSVHGRGGLAHLSTVLTWLQVWGQEWRLGNGLRVPWPDSCFLLQASRVSPPPQPSHSGLHLCEQYLSHDIILCQVSRRVVARLVLHGGNKQATVSRPRSGWILRVSGGGGLHSVRFQLCVQRWHQSRKAQRPSCPVPCSFQPVLPVSAGLSLRFSGHIYPSLAYNSLGTPLPDAREKNYSLHGILVCQINRPPLTLSKFA